MTGREGITAVPPPFGQFPAVVKAPGGPRIEHAALRGTRLIVTQPGRRSERVPYDPHLPARLPSFALARVRNGHVPSRDPFTAALSSCSQDVEPRAASQTTRGGGEPGPSLESYIRRYQNSNSGDAMKRLSGLALLPLFLAACSWTGSVQVPGAASSAGNEAASSHVNLKRPQGTSSFLYALSNGDIRRWDLADPHGSAKEYGEGDGFGLAVDTKGRVYESYCDCTSTPTTAVDVFDGKRLSEPPIRSLTLGDEETFGEASLALDGRRRLYVGGGTLLTPVIEVFAPGASGTAAPIRTISGSNTALLEVWSLAVDADGYLYVDTGGVGFTFSILVFAPGADGNVAPVRTIECTCFQSPVNIALGADGNIYVANGQDIVVFPRSANGLVNPIWTLNAGRNMGYTIALGEGGIMYVGPNANGKQRIAIYAAGASGNAKPIGFIRGNTKDHEIDGPSRLVLSEPWY